MRSEPWRGSITGPNHLHVDGHVLSIAQITFSRHTTGGQARPLVAAKSRKPEDLPNAAPGNDHPPQLAPLVRCGCHALRHLLSGGNHSATGPGGSPGTEAQAAGTAAPEGLSLAQHRQRVNKRFFADYDRYLDRTCQIDWLAQPPLAALIRGNLYHHNNGKYHLLAYCVMPNHVHVLFQPIGDEPAARSPVATAEGASQQARPLAATTPARTVNQQARPLAATSLAGTASQRKSPTMSGSVQRVPCLAGIRRRFPAERARVQSPGRRPVSSRRRRFGQMKFRPGRSGRPQGSKALPGLFSLPGAEIGGGSFSRKMNRRRFDLCLNVNYLPRRG